MTLGSLIATLDASAWMAAWMAAWIGALIAAQRLDEKAWFIVLLSHAH
jgi:hypothetical protein